MHIFLDQKTIAELFWDQPDMSRERVSAIAKHPDSNEFYQLLRRMVERLPKERLLQHIDRKTLYAQFPKLRIWNKLSVQKATELFSTIYRSSIQ